MKTDRLGEKHSGQARARGFTLVELMVTVAIAAILLSLAVPAYREYLRRGAVAEAVAAIGQGRVVAEQFFLDNRTYDGMPCPTSTDSFDIVCDNPDVPDDTIDQANLRTTAGPWGSGNCWITRKGNGC